MKKTSHEGTITINNIHVQCAILDSGERIVSDSSFADSLDAISYISTEGDQSGYLVTEPNLIAVIDQALGYSVVKSDDFSERLKKLLNLME